MDLNRISFFLSQTSNRSICTWTSWTKFTLIRQTYTRWQNTYSCITVYALRALDFISTCDVLECTLWYSHVHWGFKVDVYVQHITDCWMRSFCIRYRIDTKKDWTIGIPNPCWIHPWLANNELNVTGRSIDFLTLNNDFGDKSSALWIKIPNLQQIHLLK